MKTNILVLVGRNGVGKDFFADTLCVSRGNVEKFCFGDAVKKYCIEAFPWIPKDCFYRNELKDVVFEHPLNIQKLTPRQIIHHISSSLQHIDPYIFTRKTLDEVNSSLKSVDCLHVITDMRIQREFQELQKIGRQCKVTYVRVVDVNAPQRPPVDKFEEWVDNFNQENFVFNNLKEGPEGVLRFVNRYKIC